MYFLWDLCRFHASLGRSRSCTAVLANGTAVDAVFTLSEHFDGGRTRSQFSNRESTSHTLRGGPAVTW